MPRKHYGRGTHPLPPGAVTDLSATALAGPAARALAIGVPWDQDRLVCSNVDVTARPPTHHTERSHGPVRTRAGRAIGIGHPVALEQSLYQGHVRRRCQSIALSTSGSILGRRRAFSAESGRWPA